MQGTTKEIPTLFTVPTAAQMLCRSVSSLRRDVRRRKIGFVRIGGSIRITADEIQRTIQAGTVERVSGR